ncbi:MAG: ATP-binding cassette domain-containing protein, partial [Gammaproteobacteria bacterium]|nr:ATP-binding cassette domain-containing protein [Gammaproteobacteria bacterium]
MTNVITTRSLHRYFEVGDSKVHALNDVNLDVKAGEFIAIMGPSGSGKSTLMNILGCLDSPDEGEYRLLDQPVADLDDTELSSFRNQYIGFVFQSFHLLPRLTALENVTLPLRFAKEGITEGRNRAYELLNRLGLYYRRTHRPNQLSGGQR